MTDILIGEFNNDDLSLYGYTNSTDEESSDFLYGQLNKEVELKEYQGLDSDTAKTTVNNVDDKIKVDVLKVPNALIIKKDDTILGTYDGSEAIEITIPDIDESKFATKEQYESQQRDLLILSNNFSTLETNVNTSLSSFKTQLDGVVTTISEHTNQINNLIEYKASKEELNTEITNRTNADTLLEQNINSKLDLKLDKTSANVDLIKTTGINVTGDSVYLNTSTYNISTGTTSEVESKEVISAASDSNSGLMTSADVKELQALRQDVTILQGVNIRLLYSTKDQPTASEIQQFVIDSGFPWDETTKNWYHIAVVVKATNHVWRYYENSIEWVDAGQDLVSQFTNDVAGIIKGSNDDGKVYAETDGTGSVKGWDDLKNTVNTKVDVSLSNINSTGKQVIKDLAKTEIPTKTSQLTNDSNFVVDANYVHTDNNFTDTYKSNIETNNAKVSNVQADWNATEGLAVILNKPTDLGKVDDVKVNGTSVVENKIATITVPTEYLKTAIVSNDTLTITNQSGETVEFEGGGTWLWREW